MIDSLRCFVAAVDFGSLSKAAVQLDMTVSSVSRKINALENDLKARLLLRSSRQLVLTDAGERFLPRARNILAELDDGRNAVQELESEPHGLLTVTAPSAFSRMHVTPAIAAFLRRYPLMEIDLHASDDVVDLTVHRVDVALRMGTLPDSDLVATRLVGMNRIVCASPCYLEQHGYPKAYEDLLSHRCLTVTGRTAPPGWWRFEGVNNNHPLVVRGNFRCDNSDSLLHAAIDGVGVAHLANWLVSDAVVSGLLVPLFPMDPIERSETPSLRLLGEPAIHAVHMPGRSNQAKARIFIQFLKEYFGNPPYWDLALEKAGAGTLRPTV